MWFISKHRFKDILGFFHLEKGFIPLQDFAHLSLEKQNEIKKDVNVDNLHEKIYELKVLNNL